MSDRHTLETHPCNCGHTLNRVVVFENGQWWRYGYNDFLDADDTDIYPCKQMIL